MTTFLPAGDREAGEEVADNGRPNRKGSGNHYLPCHHAYCSCIAVPVVLDKFFQL